MEAILGMLGGQVIPIVVLGLVLVTISILLTVARNYYKVSPNEVAVITGRSYVLTDPDGKKVKRGFRVVTGGGFFKFPVLERVDVIKLNVLTIPVQVENVPDKNGALVSVIGVTNVKILSDAQSLPLAVERFLGFTDEQITDVARENLEGNLRAIVGTMEIEELIRDRQALQTKILSEAVADLAKLGLGVDLLTIKDINDERNYIGSLGKKRTAEVVRDATIGEAEAMRDANIKSAEARQLGETAKAKADQAISDANRERDMVIADNTAKVGAQQARIPIAAQIATAEETKELNIANVAAEQARIEAETNLQAAERKRHEAELEASTIVQAEKDRESKVIAADAEQQAATKTGEAGRIIAEKAGQGTQAKLTGEAIGRKAAAEALQAELEAEAAGEKAKLLAAAAGIEADLLAKASGTRAMLLAEAEGTLKKAEAYEKLDDTGRFLMILQALPPVVESLGDAIERFMKPAAEAIGQGLANVDEIKIIDFGGQGGANGSGGSVLQRFANLPVETIYNIVEKLKATNMAPLFIEGAKRLGVDITPLFAGAPTPAVTAAVPDTTTQDG